MLANSQSIYNTDYAVWLEQNITLLKQGEYQQIDWQNLIEELESLGKSQKRELKSRLSTLLEHCLKLLYTNYSQDFRGWRITIKRTQQELLDLLAESPSLNNIWTEILHLAYTDALKILTQSVDYQTFNFPQIYPFPLEIEILLQTDFWES
jgi:Domain of unknown function DUF29